MSVDDTEPSARSLQCGGKWDCFEDDGCVHELNDTDSECLNWFMQSHFQSRMDGFYCKLDHNADHIFKLDFREMKITDMNSNKVFKLRNRLKLECIETNLERTESPCDISADSIEGSDEFASHSDIMADTFCAHNHPDFEVFSPEARRDCIRTFCTQYLSDKRDGDCLYKLALFALSFDEPVYFPQGLGSLTAKEMWVELVRLFPKDGASYIRLSKRLQDDETLTLVDGSIVDKKKLVQLALDLDPLNPLVLHDRAVEEDNKNAKEELEMKCFDICGGGFSLHPFMDYAMSGIQLTEQQRITRAVTTINTILRELGGELSSDVHDDAIMFFPLLRVRLVQNYLGFFRNIVADFLFEVAALLRDGQFVEIDGKLLGKDQLLTMAESLGMRALANRIFLVRGVDHGRNAWYYVLVTGSVKKFQHCLHDEVIHLKDHGRVIQSAYGDGPPARVEEEVKVQYGISDSTGPQPPLASVRHLAGFLAHVPDLSAGEAVACLLYLDYEALRTVCPGAWAPTREQLDSLLRQARAKAMQTSVPGWADGPIEPYLSWKMAICLYTMSSRVPGGAEPLSVCRLLNAPLNHRARSLTHLTHQRPLLRLLVTALRRWPAVLRFCGPVFRGVRPEELPAAAARADPSAAAADAASAGLEPGALLYFAAPTSASKCPEVAQLFGGGDGGLVYRIHGAAGCDIGRLSLHSSEHEVLLAPPVVVRVKKLRRQGAALSVRGRVVQRPLTYL